MYDPVYHVSAGAEDFKLNKNILSGKKKRSASDGEGNDN